MALPKLYLQEGARWRRHRPRWLLVERTFVGGLWRSSQAAFRGWATTTTTEATLPMLPPLYKVLHLSWHALSMFVESLGRSTPTRMVASHLITWHVLTATLQLKGALGLRHELSLKVCPCGTARP